MQMLLTSQANRSHIAGGCVGDKAACTMVSPAARNMVAIHYSGCYPVSRWGANARKKDFQNDWERNENKCPDVIVFSRCCRRIPPASRRCAGRWGKRSLPTATRRVCDVVRNDAKLLIFKTLGIQ